MYFIRVKILTIVARGIKKLNKHTLMLTFVGTFSHLTLLINKAALRFGTISPSVFRRKRTSRMTSKQTCLYCMCWLFYVFYVLSFHTSFASLGKTGWLMEGTILLFVAGNYQYAVSKELKKGNSSTACSFTAISQTNLCVSSPKEQWLCNHHLESFLIFLAN